MESGFCCLFYRSAHRHCLCHAGVRFLLSVLQVCSQTLSLPCGTSILSASVAAGHLSSASIYPACFAPYLLTTACSDGRIRFWRCIVQDVEASMCHDNCFSSSSYQYPMAGHSTVLPAVTSRQEWKPLEHDYCWSEWSMMSSVNRSSAVDVPGEVYCVCKTLITFLCLGFL